MTVTLTAATFLFENLHTLYLQVARGDDIYFESLQTNGQSVIYNNGYRPVVALRAEFDVPSLNISDNLNLYQTINPGELKTTGSESLFSRSFSLSTPVDLKLLDDYPEFFYADVTTPFDPDYRRAMEANPDMGRFACEGTLIYLPVGADQEESIDIDCTGIIVFNNEKLSRAEYLTLYLANGGH